MSHEITYEQKSGIDTKEARRIAALMGDENGYERVARAGVGAATVAHMIDAMADAIDDLCGPREATQRPIADDVDERGPTVAERLTRYRCTFGPLIYQDATESIDADWTSIAENTEDLAHAMLDAERPVKP